jgi:hypothetical protein
LLKRDGQQERALKQIKAERRQAFLSPFKSLKSVPFSFLSSSTSIPTLADPNKICGDSVTSLADGFARNAARHWSENGAGEGNRTLV